eukprot:1552007-Pyramimonas_sp.AAC.1
MIEELVGARGRTFLEGEGERMRLTADEHLTEAQLQDIPCYVDPALTRNRRKYVRFLKDLHRRGLVKFSLSCRERVGLFFAKKKSGQLRMILDARRANAHCRPPPHASLLTSEGLGNIEVKGGAGVSSELAVGTVDVADAFHLSLIHISEPTRPEPI